MGEDAANRRRGSALGSLRAAGFALLAAVPALASAPSSAKEKFVALGTSSQSGVYYPVAQGICGLINGGRDEHLVRCLANTTGGSIYNIQAIATGELDFALTRAGLAYEAYRGIGEFEAYGANPKLRSMSVLYSQPLSVIVKQDSDVKTFLDIVGKRINIGNLGSGKRELAEMMLELMRWTSKDFAEVHELNTSRMGKAFCEDKVDVLIEAIGIPSKFLDDMINGCKGRFVDIPKNVVDAVRLKGPYYEPGVIPAKLYPIHKKDVQTFNVNVVLVSSTDTSAETIYTITKTMFEKFPLLQKTHAVFANMTPKSMVEQAEYIPFHEGALRYYRESNLLPATQAKK